jgi:hypothetical protein
MVRRVEGQCVGAVLVLAKGAIFEQSIHLENYCANNQAEFDDSLLVVQQVIGVFQCFDGSLNTYLDKCIEIIALFDNFTVQHVFRQENTMTNYLAQQASGF